MEKWFKWKLFCDASPILRLNTFIIISLLITYPCRICTCEEESLNNESGKSETESDIQHFNRILYAKEALGITNNGKISPIRAYIYDNDEKDLGSLGRTSDVVNLLQVMRQGHHKIRSEIKQGGVETSHHELPRESSDSNDPSLLTPQIGQKTELPLSPRLWYHVGLGGQTVKSQRDNFHHPHQVKDVSQNSKEVIASLDQFEEETASPQSSYLPEVVKEIIRNEIPDALGRIADDEGQQDDTNFHTEAKSSKISSSKRLLSEGHDTKNNVLSAILPGFILHNLAYNGTSSVPEEEEPQTDMKSSDELSNLAITPSDMHDPVSEAQVNVEQVLLPMSADTDSPISNALLPDVNVTDVNTIGGMVESAKSEELEKSSAVIDTEESIVPTEGRVGLNDAGSSDNVSDTLIAATTGRGEEEKPSEPIETYSQFAQRVRAAKQNDANSNGHNGINTKGSKVKTKNYASPECGSKLLTANPESSHSDKVIQSNRDEYMLNKCSDKIWFIIELCESIRPQKFDIANFELFSNLPKELHLWGSHRYPTRDWSQLGHYVAQEGNRGIQSFSVKGQDFFKYIKIEILNHYGSEFYCPMSLFRIYGLSEFEVIEEDSADDHEEVDEEISVKGKDTEPIFPQVLKTMFDGVVDAIKRGYRPHSNASDPGNVTQYTERCRSLSPRLAVVPERCPMAASLNYILACYYQEYESLLRRSTFVRETLERGDMTGNFGDAMNNTVKSISINNVVGTGHHYQLVPGKGMCGQLSQGLCGGIAIINDSDIYDTFCNRSYLCVMLSPRHLLALCIMHSPTLLYDPPLSPNSCPPVLARASDNASSEIAKDDISSGKLPKILENVTLENNIPVTTEDIQQGVAEAAAPTTAISDNDIIPSRVVIPPQESPTEEIPHANGKMGKDPSSHGGKDISPDQISLALPIQATVDSLTNSVVETFEGIEGSADLEEEGGEMSPTPQVVPFLEGGQRSPSPHSNSNKETIVVRLSNKIRALEHNMSISSQYLEELSRRYKRQMEDLQRQFNSTLAALNSTARTAHEQDAQQQKDIRALQQQVLNMTQLLLQMSQDSEHLSFTIIEQHLLLMAVEVLVLSFVFWLYQRRNLRLLHRVLFQANVDVMPTRVYGCTRRKSVDSTLAEKSVNNQPILERVKNGEQHDYLKVDPLIEKKQNLGDGTKNPKKSHVTTLTRASARSCSSPIIDRGVFGVCKGVERESMPTPPVSPIAITPTSSFSDASCSSLDSNDNVFDDYISNGVQEIVPDWQSLDSTYGHYQSNDFSTADFSARTLNVLSKPLSVSVAGKCDLLVQNGTAANSLKNNDTLNQNLQHQTYGYHSLLHSLEDLPILPLPNSISVTNAYKFDGSKSPMHLAMKSQCSGSVPREREGAKRGQMGVTKKRGRGRDKC